MGDLPASTSKTTTRADDLSSRDVSLLDDFIAGTSRKALAEKYHVTRVRISQILHRPASVAYLTQRAGVGRTLLFARAGEELLARMEWGGMKLADVLAIWKAAMPQETTVTVNLLVQREAERLAAEMGLDPADVLAEAEAIVQGAT